MKILKKIFAKIKLQLLCWKLDAKYYGGPTFYSCFGGYPPSWYLKHTPEEQKRLHAENIQYLKDMLHEYEENMRKEKEKEESAQ